MIPPTLRRHVTSVWGEAGTRWLATLPETLDRIAADWELTVGAPFDLTFHYVTAVTTADGAPGVLKLGVPEGDSLREESRALAAFGGQGAVHLRRSDLDRGALLLERAVPGVRARDVPDVEATAALAGAMRDLHRPGDVLPDLVGQADAFDEYLARFPDGGGPLPADLVVTAGGLMRELCASAPARVLLHGDLHHDNLLSADRAPWLAIDPHGVSGDPGYEIGSWLFNPDPDNRDPALLALVPARLEQLADLTGQPLDRLVAWGFVKAVLSDVWSVEAWHPGDERAPDSRALDVAQLLWPQVSRRA
ncbi:aminoglycoside phosphotransferase family protein [Dactylosporangium sp. NPDC051541]|uniref:aminoglycoside phosphotransferase family protein n=1 Tax=Dactylosporangium sp. NPDC051541 TaxID=3363977 RepID=UPI003791B752